MQRSTLPAPLGDLVRHVVTSARLNRRERGEVTAELEAHFIDGLEAGATVQELAAAFGDPGSAATLIGRSKRRCRSLPLRLRLAALYALAATTLASAAVYTASAVRLYSTEPAGASAVTSEIAAAVQANTRATDLLAEARAAIAAGNGNVAAAAIAATLDLTRALGASRTLAGELARMRALDVTMTLADAASRDSALLRAGDRTWLAEHLAIELANGSLRLDAGVVNDGLGRLLDLVYSAGERGKPAAEGLHQLQLLKFNGEPRLSARVAEPLYFIAPAPRYAAEKKLAGLRRAVELEISEQSAGALQRAQGSPRLLPLVLLNRRLAEAVRVSRRLQRDAPEVIARLTAGAI